MTLIKLANGQSINPAHVVSYEDYHNGSVKFLTTAGEYILGKPVNEDFEEALYPIIPAAAGFYAVYADVKKDMSRHWYRRAIVGWQVAPGGNFPIVQGDVTGKWAVGYIEPDGTVLDVEGNSYGHLDHLKAAIEAEDLDFLMKAAFQLEPDNDDDQSGLPDSVTAHILNVHPLKIEEHQVMFFTGRIVETQAEFTFSIITESSDFAKQQLGQAEIAMLGWAAGVDPLTDEKQLIGKRVIVHRHKTGGDRFDPLPVKEQAA